MYSSSPLKINLRTKEQLLRVATEEEDSSVCSQQTPLSSPPRSGLVEALLNGILCCSVTPHDFTTETEYTTNDIDSMIHKATPVLEGDNHKKSSAPSHRRLHKASPIVDDEPDYVVMKQHCLFKTKSVDTATTASTTSMEEEALSIVDKTVEERSELSSIRTAYAQDGDDDSIFSRGYNHTTRMAAAV